MTEIQSLVVGRDAKARDVTKYESAHSRLSVHLAEDVIVLADALREIAEMPEPLNNRGSALTQLAWLKDRAREALGG